MFQARVTPILVRTGVPVDMVFVRAKKVVLVNTAKRVLSQWKHVARRKEFLKNVLESVWDAKILPGKHTVWFLLITIVVSTKKLPKNAVKKEGFERKVQ